MNGKLILKKGLAAVLTFAMFAGTQAPYAIAADNNSIAVQTKGGKLVSLDFNNGDSGLSGNGVNVKINGTTNYVEDAHEGKALSFKPDTFLELSGENGNLLAGHEELTISYWSKTPETPGCNWAAFLAPHSGGVDGSKPTYFAISDQKRIQVERYKDSRDSEAIGSAEADTWKMVTVVIDETYTTVYVNHQKIAANKSNYMLSDIVGKNGIFYIGKANWAAGEYFTGILDNYEVYDYAFTQKQVKQKYMEESDIEAEIEQAVSNLYIPQSPKKATGNIMLPKESDTGVKFEWTSSDEAVISTKAVPCETYYNEVDIPAGVVNRQKTDKTVKLDLKASYGNIEKKYSYQVTVKAANKQEEYAGYLYAHFNEHPGAPYDGIQQIFFGISKNGVDWTALNNNQYVAESSVGDYGVRDPYIIRSAEGDKFFLVGTDLDIDSYKYGGNWGLMGSKGSQGLVIWESEDLVNWSEPRLVDVASELDAGMAWAPEAIYDEATGEYLVFWSTLRKTGGEGNHIYVAKTRDFWNFTSPELYSNAGNGDDSHPVNKNGNIDASIFKQGDTYYRLLNDGFNTSICFQSSKKLLAYGKDLGDQAEVDLGTTMMPNRGANFKLIDNSGTIDVEDADGNTVTKPCLTQYAGAYEGPTMFKFNDREEWCILVDEYFRGAAAGPGRARGYIPFISKDLDQPNSIYLPSDDEFIMPDAAKHGTVIPITQTEYDRLMQKWGTKKQEGNEKESQEPVLTYDFETVQGTTVADSSTAGADNKGTLSPTAKIAEVDGHGKVLSLTGTGYLLFPEGFFDGLSKMTISMDVCPAENNANTTLFSIGSTVKNKISSYTVTADKAEEKDRYWNESDKISNRYFQLDVKKNAVEGTITTFNQYGEKKVSSNTDLDLAGKWRNVTVTADDHVISIYIDGELAAQEKHMRTIGELGVKLRTVIGMAYNSSAGFKGYVDNVNVYNMVTDPSVEPPEVKLTFIEVKAPAKTEYRVGETFDPEGMKITAVYSDNTKKDVTAEAKVEGFDSSSAGKKEMTVTYGGFTERFEITIQEKVLAEDIFTDVNAENWFTPYVQYVFENGVMTGLSETEFGTNAVLSRAHFATILYRMEGSPKVDYSNSFPDVPEGMFYTEPALWASEAAVIKGYESGDFGPDDNITREQIAVMLYRYAKYNEYDMTSTDDLSGFEDAGSVSAFAKEAMQWAVGAELIKGEGDGSQLNPQGKTSRAVCATLIMRFMEQYEN